jgi:uncharacterized protein (DUF983 family)
VSLEPRAGQTEPGSTPAVAPQALAPAPKRSFARAVWRGLIGRCPNCGRGAMFSVYLRVKPRCPVCDEDLSAEHADDAPAFITLLIGGCIGGGGVLFSDSAFPDMPIAVTAIVWIIATTIVCLLILPRIKGAVIGSEWALRAVGFSVERTAEGAIKDDRPP